MGYYSYFPGQETDALSGLRAGARKLQGISLQRPRSYSGSPDRGPVACTRLSLLEMEVRGGGGSVCLARSSWRPWEERRGAQSHPEKLMFFGRKRGRVKVHLILVSLYGPSKVSHVDGRELREMNLF